MARYTFVTESHLRVDEKKTVEILSRAEVEDIAAEAAKTANSSLARRISSQDRKLAKVVEQSAAAAKDATAAKEDVKRLVEKARETFREVIEEILEPHYRFLAQHLGIELPAQLTSVASTRETAPVALPSNGSVSAKTMKKTTRRIMRAADEDGKDPPAHPKRKTTSAAKTSTASKKMATRKKSATRVAQSRRKGSRPCPKK